MNGPLRVATRGSKLARWQADHVIRALKREHHGLETEIVEIRTTGDVIQDVPLSAVGSSAFFTREIEHALLADQADLAVHSLKDLASTDVPGLTVGAVMLREDVRDALVARQRTTLMELPAGSTVGTSSVRRRALVASLRPDLRLLDLRGNVPTRLRKLGDEHYDAIILATAGLNRLELDEHITEHLDPTTFIPAAGQGAIGLQVRADDADTKALLAPLQHASTRAAVDAERAFLAELAVGCQAPVGVHARVDDDDLELRAVVLSVDGTQRIDLSGAGRTGSAVQLGGELAAEARKRGAVALLDAARQRSVSS